MKKWIIVVLMLIIALSATNLYWWQSWNGWQEKEGLFLSRLDNSRLELDAAKEALVDKQSEFNGFLLGIEKNLLEVNSKFEDTKIQLDNAVDHTFFLASELEGVRAELKSQKRYYESKLLEEIKLAKGLGYQEALARAVPLRNPTYKELKEFLSQNKVNLRTWIPRKYVCVDFAADLNNNAEAAGFRSAYVWLIEGYGSNGSKWGHLLNGFQTVDRGLIYIEPQTDAEADIKVGEYYPYIQGSIKEIIIIW